MAKKIIVVLFFCFFQLSAQQFNFIKYDVKEGVALSQIGDLGSFSDGRLIVSTMGGGINIYDGHHFDLYNSLNGLPNNLIYRILVVSDTLVWIGTDKGLSRFDGVNFFNYGEKDGLPSESIWSLALGLDSTLWIGTDNGLAQYKNGEFKKVDHPLINSEGIWSLFCCSNGNLWISLLEGIIKYDNKQNVFRELKELSSLSYVNVFNEDNDGVIWAGSDYGLYKIKENSYTSFSNDPMLKDIAILAIEQDSQNRIWLGTDEGVRIISDNIVKKIGADEGLTDYKIWSIVEDLEKNIWLGSDEGLYKMSDMSFRIFKNFNGKPIDVWSILEREKNSYWLLSELQGIVRFKNGQFSELNFGGISKKGLSSFLIDEDNNVWLGSDRGIFKYSKNNFSKPILKYTNIDGSVNTILQRPNGDILFGTFYNGTIIYNGKNFQSIKNSSSSSSTINDFLLDSNNQLWVATEGGLCIIKNDSCFVPPGFEKLTKYSFSNLIEDSFGNIWAGSYEDGLFTFNSKYIDSVRIDKVSQKHGLNNTAIMATTFDEDNNLWISTNVGFNKLNIEEYHKSGRKEIIAYGMQDGIPGVEGYQNGILTDSNNNLLISTIDGLVVFDPKTLTKNTRPPTVQIRSIKILDKDFNETIYSRDQVRKNKNFMELPYYQNNLTIEFVGISLTNPSHVKYSYQLNDNQWTTPTADPKIYLPNLDHGDYKIKMKAGNNNGVWSQEYGVLNIKITAPFWRILWVQILIVFLLVGLIVLFYLFRLNRMNKLNMDLEERIQERIAYEAKLKQTAKELVIAKEEAEKSDKLKSEFLAQMSHEIRTPINAILSYASLIKEMIPSNSDEQIEDGFIVIENSSHRLIRTIDSILNLSQLQTESLELNKKTQNISNILHDLYDEFKGIVSKKNIDFNLEMFSEECMVYIDQYTFTQMIANLIDNAIKYTDHGQIKLALSNGSKKNVVVEVRDTGIGMTQEFQKQLFNPFTQEEQGYTRKYEGAGLGLSLVEKYAQINKVDLSFKSKKDSGTTFRIKIPQN